MGPRRRRRRRAGWQPSARVGGGPGGPRGRLGTPGQPRRRQDNRWWVDRRAHWRRVDQATAPRGCGHRRSARRTARARDRDWPGGLPADRPDRSHARYRHRPALGDRFRGRHPSSSDAVVRDRVSPAAARGFLGVQTPAANRRRSLQAVHGGVSRVSTGRRLHQARGARGGSLDHPVGLPGDDCFLRAPRATAGGARCGVGERVRPYLFYDVAVSICSTCYRKVEGKIVFQDGCVYMLKRCPAHGARAGAAGRRRRVLPPVPRGVHQAAGDAAAASTRRSDGAARTTAGSARITSSTRACRSSRSPTTAISNARSATPEAGRRGSSTGASITSSG